MDERRREILNTEIYEHFIVNDKLFGDSINGRVPIDYDLLLKDHRFESLVRSIIINRKWFLGEKIRRTIEMKVLIDDISKELKRF